MWGKSVEEISIPTGAIKSTLIGCEKTELPKFQFLLVRLKVKERTDKMFANKPFQFLLVRLKVVGITNIGAIITNFNSYWCD